MNGPCAAWATTRCSKIHRTMRAVLQPAYIIHARAYRNTSLLLDVFTRDYGLIGAVARGARRPYDERRVLLQPLTALQVSFSGRGELVTLTQVERADPGIFTTGGSPALSGRSLYSGLYLNELLQRLLHRHDPHEGVFEAYHEAVESLGASPGRPEPVLRRFELTLLRELGYGLQLPPAGGDEPLDPDGWYRYDIERGPVAESLASPEAPRISGRALAALEAGRFDDADCAGEIKNLMRYVLAHYLGAKPLKSRELFTPVGGRAD